MIVNYFQNYIIYFKKRFFFLCIILSIIIKLIISVITEFSAYNSYSGNIILLTNDGIYFYNRDWKNITCGTVEFINQFITYESHKDFASLSQFPQNNYKNITLVAMEYRIYHCYDDVTCITNINYYDLGYYYKLLIPYKIIGNYYRFILAGIEHNNFHLVMFNLTFGSKTTIKIQYSQIYKYEIYQGKIQPLLIILQIYLAVRFIQHKIC